MSEILTGCRDLLLKLVDSHLTAKSHGRINHVFNHYSDPQLLTQLYNPDGPFKPNLNKICTGLNRLLEEGTLWECEQVYDCERDTGRSAWRGLLRTQERTVEGQEVSMLQMRTAEICDPRFTWCSHSLICYFPKRVLPRVKKYENMQDDVKLMSPDELCLHEWSSWKVRIRLRLCQPPDFIQWNFRPRFHILIYYSSFYVFFSLSLAILCTV